MICDSKYKKVISCKTCGEPVIVYKANKNAEYCSRKCQNSSVRMKAISAKNGRANKGKRLGSVNPNWSGGGKQFICKECDKSFNVPINELTGGKRKGLFCSHVCWKEYLSKNKMSDAQSKVQRNMRRAILYQIKNKGRKPWTSLVGYSREELMDHLEKQFKNGMSWGNYGEWHIDHIKPTSAFRFNSYKDKEFLECWDLNNLQPLWAKENLSKGGTNKCDYISV